MNQSRYQTAGCFLICFLLLAGIQHWSGATQAAFDGYPDEPSHYLSGLMIRDYIMAGFPAAPRAYALNYYLHVPFFAVGYWPPLFYVLEGLWMTVAGYSRPEALLFLALIAALISATVFAVTRRVLGVAGAFCCGILFLLLPDVLSNSAMVMTDTAIALFSFWSVLALARYFERGRWRDAMLFSVLAACTILTKYSGFYLALLPPLALLACRRWDLLRRPSFWCQPIFVALLLAPWVYFTHQFATAGFDSFQRIGFFTALFDTLRLWVIDFGPWLAALLFGAWVYTGIFLGQANALCRILWLQPVAVLLFQALAPVCCETRWLIPTFAPLLVLLAFALGRLPKYYGPAVVAVTAATLALVSLPHFHRSPNPIRPVVESILHRVDPNRQTVVYVPADQEGPVIAEFAMRDARRPARILARPNKLLAKMDWLGNNYKPYYQQPAEVQQYFVENPPDLVIVHSSLPAAALRAHERLLAATISQYPDSWRLVAHTEEFDVYQFHAASDARPAGIKPGITPLYRRRIAGKYEAN